MATLSPDLSRDVWDTSLRSAARHVTLRAYDWRDLTGDAEVDRWDALAKATAEPNPFFESWYLLPSLKNLDPLGQVSILCLEADGQLVGLMPIRRYPSYYGYPLPHLRNWVHDNCFCGLPLIAQGFETHFWKEVLTWCDEQGGAPLFLHLTQMPGQGVAHLSLKALVDFQNRSAATVAREERAFLHSQLSAEDYWLASVTSKKRKELRRQHRRLAEHGELTISRQRSADESEQWAADFLQLEKRGWKGRAGSALSSAPANAAIFGDAIKGAARRGKVEMLTLSLDGRPIAMLATFLAVPGAFSFKTAFDENYARFSPGVLLQKENLTLLEDETVRWVDSCAAEDHKMIDHIWRERRRMVRHSIGIGGVLRRAAFSALVRKETGKRAGGIS